MSWSLAQFWKQSCEQISSVFKKIFCKGFSVARQVACFWNAFDHRLKTWSHTDNNTFYRLGSYTFVYVCVCKCVHECALQAMSFQPGSKTIHQKTKGTYLRKWALGNGIVFHNYENVLALPNIDSIVKQNYFKVRDLIYVGRGWSLVAFCYRYGADTPVI